MKRSFAFLLLILLCLPCAFGDQNVIIGLEAGYFGPQNQDFRDFYGGGLQLGAELSVNVFKNDILVWFGTRYFSKTSQLSFTQEDIALRLYPIYLGLGVKFLHKSRWRPYIGGGVSLNIFRESAPLETVKKTKTGYWGQAGILLQITSHIFLECKSIYNYCLMEFPKVDVDISGFSWMLGLKFQI